MSAPSNFTPEKRKKFLKYLSEGHSVTGACNAARVSRPTMYDLRKTDVEFAREWDEAVEAGTDALEDEARRRAYKGTKKPIYQGGKLVGYIQEYSDTLLIFLLKGRRPEKFRERVEAEIKGNLQVEYVNDWRNVGQDNSEEKA